MDNILFSLFPIFAFIAVVSLLVYLTARKDMTIIYEYQFAVLYKDGKFERLLEAGAHTINRNRQSVQTIDKRAFSLSVAGQEILTKDKINIKISLYGRYCVTNPILALHNSTNYYSDLYNICQMTLRSEIAALNLDEILEIKSDFDNRMVELCNAAVENIGLKVESLGIKDIILPASLKRAYSGILEAQKDAQRKLEIARAEQAVLRSLANSSKAYENNPLLLQARLIQTLANGNNSIIFNADDKIVLKSNKDK